MDVETTRGCEKVYRNGRLIDASYSYYVGKQAANRYWAKKASQWKAKRRGLRVGWLFVLLADYGTVARLADG